MSTSQFSYEAGAGPRPEHRHAKIVCTIGPSSHTKEILREMMRLGMNVARLNFSHGTHESHARLIERIREAASAESCTICVLQDLQGPKIRTGLLKDGVPVSLRANSKVTITPGQVPGTPQTISTTFTTLAQEVRPGDRILLSDGKIELSVVKVEGDDVICDVVHGGLLGEHQGINLPGVALGISALTEKDHKDLEFGLKHGVDVVAVSFVRSGNDIYEVRSAMQRYGRIVPIVAKLEKPQAIDNLEKILEATDGVMVARGDLGVEVAPERVPIIQKHVIRRAAEFRRPVITATQMLESMIENPRPTRAEASDVANAIFDGSDAVMLSGETASGKYPREAVSIMSRIIRETEAHMVEAAMPLRRNRQITTVSEAICESVAHVAHDLKIKAIAVFTESGNTARLISKYRPDAPVYAFAHILEVCNRLNILWGVTPVLCEPLLTGDQMIHGSETELLRLGVVERGDVIAVVAGTRTTSGSTNFMRLHVVGEHRPASSVNPRGKAGSGKKSKGRKG